MNRQQHKQKAGELWEKMEENERYGVRFGLFPNARMQEAEGEGYDGKEIAVGLMEIAQGARWR